VSRRLPPPLRVRGFALLWLALVVDGLAGQMATVAVGWQVYDIHRDPLDLGLIGLAEFAPLPLLALPAGHVADLLPRKLVFATSIVLAAVVTLLLLFVTLAGADELWPFLALAAATGVSSAVGSPAGRALPPELVPHEILASAMALRSTGVQAAVVAGPALGGILFAVQPELVYSVATGLFAVACICALALPRAPRAVAAAEVRPVPGLAGVLDGVRFIRRTPILLGAITLDLFAVLFGGAVALLPLFARDVLDVGPTGLGVLRSAPAAGAVVAGILLTRWPLRGDVGRKLLIVVAGFGASMVVFGLSRTFLLSLVALAVSGFTDMVSMNIRSTTAALATPDELRGRVNAVEMVFISASNELGAFESGLAAAILGAVPAVVAGGVATVAVAVVWVRLFPPLARLDRFEDLQPVPAAAGAVPG
jgi:MFS family permease